MLSCSPASGLVQLSVRFPMRPSAFNSTESADIACRDGLAVYSRSEARIYRYLGETLFRNSASKKNCVREFDPLIRTGTFFCCDYQVSTSKSRRSAFIFAHFLSDKDVPRDIRREVFDVSDRSNIPTGFLVFFSLE